MPLPRRKVNVKYYSSNLICFSCSNLCFGVRTIAITLRTSSRFTEKDVVFVGQVVCGVTNVSATLDANFYQLQS